MERQGNNMQEHTPTFPEYLLYQRNPTQLYGCLQQQVSESQQAQSEANLVGIFRRIGKDAIDMAKLGVMLDDEQMRSLRWHVDTAIKKGYIRKIRNILLVHGIQCHIGGWKLALTFAKCGIDARDDINVDW